ncbi:glycosyltransferase family 2 protein [Rhizobium sp. RU36D]|uniref:glycosyltransferase family 2 protein n=1 Tax=Rhizobium sp. RU36D TaxID=1907415 RepID=UPI001FCDF7BE|nr:glycosyltransferase family 2 protein [Rhizobium sp. RU36D]
MGKNAPEAIAAICRGDAEETRKTFARIGRLNTLEYELSAVRQGGQDVADQGSATAADGGSLEALLRERDTLIVERDDAYRYRQECSIQLDAKTRKVAQLENRLKYEMVKTYTRISELDKAIEQMKASASWRMTAPYRWTGLKVKQTLDLLRATPGMIQRQGGFLKFISKSVSVVRRDGIRGALSAWRYANALPGSANGRARKTIDYGTWLKNYATLDDAAIATMTEQVARWQNPPLISVVMPVYNAPLDLLKEAVASVQAQIYPRWELCIADDCSTLEEVRDYLKALPETDSRIKVCFREVNGHISEASNSAIEIATGGWVALFDQDDMLTKDALFYVAREIVHNKDVKLIYSDEDKIEGTKRYDPYFKPDWNPDLLRSHNLVCHLGVYEIGRVRAIGGFRKGLEGAQDHDLVLRFSEGLKANEIVHIPRVLYHWRSHSGSTAQSANNKSYAVVAGRKAIQEHLGRIGLRGTVDILPTNMYRVKYDLPDVLPLVTIIIPTRNGLSLLRQCIQSVLAKTTYPNYEIIIVDNNSDDPATLAYLSEMEQQANIRVTRDSSPFNYSKLNNDAVAIANGEFVLLMNNDIEVISPEWLSEMMGLAIQPDVGAVGARLWYPDDTLQHGGVILGIGGVAGHPHKFLAKGAYGYFSRGELTQTLSVVTAACLLIRKSVYEAVGGLDEKNLKVAFNDVDFCIRVRDAGYRNVWTPYAELYHHESATRGVEDTPEKKERFRSEVLYMLDKWKDALIQDPAYNPNLTLDHEDFSLASPPRNDGDPTLAS